MKVQRVAVDLGSRSYSVVVAASGVDFVAARLAAHRAPLRFVTDPSLERRVWPALAAALRRRGREPESPILVPAGERGKSWNELARLQSALLRSGADRGTCVVALGGGAVLDLAGFAAATFMRGIDWIAVPTTLLAMVDAAVGGKVAVNLGRTKNVVGAFHQPRAVIAATELLRTLPARQRGSGLGEVVKYAMIADRRLFGALERHGRALRRPRARHDAALVLRCCRIKAQVVGADERESGARAVLNFGHTVGHAIEAVGAGRWLHGEAIGLGMLVAAAIAEDRGVAREPQVARLRHLLGELGLPVVAPRAIRPAALRRAWKRDKKARDGVPRFVLTPRIGAASVGHHVPEASVVAALRVIRGPRFDSDPSPHPKTRPGAKRRAEGGR